MHARKDLTSCRGPEDAGMQGGGVASGKHPDHHLFTPEGFRMMLRRTASAQLRVFSSNNIDICIINPRIPVVETGANSHATSLPSSSSLPSSRGRKRRGCDEDGLQQSLGSLFGSSECEQGSGRRCCPCHTHTSAGVRTAPAVLPAPAPTLHTSEVRKERYRGGGGGGGGHEEKTGDTILSARGPLRIAPSVPPKKKTTHAQGVGGGGRRRRRDIRPRIRTKDSSQWRDMCRFAALQQNKRNRLEATGRDR
ncbi:hypothetical protein Q8A73_016746 [Channa argus]|nr:hypothetical protein Q8A73_016746 [Channa argus]